MEFNGVYMKLKEIDSSVFQKFAETHPLYNFCQSRGMIESHNIRGVENYSLGFYNQNNDLLAATYLFTSKNKRIIKTANVYYGFLIDFKNPSLVNEFNKQLIQFCKTKHYARLTVHPYLQGYSYQDESPTKLDTSSLDQLFLQSGFNKLETKIDYTSLINLFFLKDLTKYSNFQEAFNSFQPNLQRLIKKTDSECHITIEEIEFEELERHSKIEHASAEKTGVRPRDLLYYQSIYKGFKPLDSVHFLIAKMDVNRYKKEQLEKIKTLENANALIQAKPKISKKQNNKINANLEIISGIKNRLQSIADINPENKIDIASCMALSTPAEMTVLEMGQYEEFEIFSPISLLYAELMNKAFQRAIPIFNFYGTFDVDKPASKGYGIYQYKKRFGGELYQLIDGYSIDLNVFARLIDL